MNSYLFRIYQEAELAQIQEGLHAPLKRWLSAWIGHEVSSLEVRNVQGSDDTFAPLLLASLNAENSLNRPLKHVIPLPEQAAELPDFLGHLIPDSTLSDKEFSFDSTTAQRVSSALKTSALNDLLALCSSEAKDASTWQHQLDAPTSQRVARKFRLGSGWCVAMLTQGARTLPLLISPALIGLWVNRPIPVVKGGLPRARSVLADQSVSLRANLGSTTLTIGDIRQLTVGDVVRLDAACDSSIELTASGQQRVAVGVLGLFEGCKALSLTK